MFAPFTVCCFIKFEFFVGQLARLFQHAVVDADFAHVVQQRGDAQPVEIFGIQAQAVAENQRIFRHAAGVASRVGILFVDGRREHADRAQERARDFPSAACFSCSTYSSMSPAMWLNVSASSPISAVPRHGHAFVEFRAADGADGFDQAANRPRDAHARTDIRGPARQT